jgi:hypothetical protein
MRKSIIILALLVAAISAGAQERDTKNYTREGNVFVQSAASQILPDDRVTDYVWRDNKGSEYPIILHTYTKGEKAGKTTCYVIRRSAKSGKDYRYFIPDGERIAEEIIREGK